MKKIIFTILIIVATVFILPRLSFAQVTFRNPINITPTKSLNLFDNDSNIVGKKTIYNCTVLTGISSLEDNHRGVDFTVPTGTTVFATGAGRVYRTENTCDDIGYVDNPCGGKFGNYNYIDHDADTADGKGLVSIYAHMKKGTVTTPLYTPVSCGQQIGQSASSGSSSGSHLHFEVRNNTSTSYTALDPFAGACSHPAPPDWTSVNDTTGQPTTTCDNHPLAPSNVVINNATTSSLRVNFKDNATDETNILVERKISVPSGTWIQVASFGTLTGTSSWYWTNTSLASKATFCYRLRAITATGSSAYSSEACGTTL